MNHFLCGTGIFLLLALKDLVLHLLASMIFYWLMNRKG